MDSTLALQIIIGLCFVGIITILFLETQDYLTFSIIFVMIIGLSTYFLRGLTESEAEGIILAVDWDVIVFLICLFSIVEILNDKKIFQQIAVRIVNRYSLRPRPLFYAICVTSTMIATVIEDLSIAIIFIPIVIQACRGIHISPVPYMYGVTICINLASTLTPFGSAENIIIANHFNLSLHWHLVYLGVYFVVVLFTTLFLLDRFLLTHYLKRYYYNLYSAIPGYFNPNQIDSHSSYEVSNFEHKRKDSHHLSEEFLKNARLKEIKEKVLKTIETAQRNALINKNGHRTTGNTNGENWNQIGNDMITIAVTETQIKQILDHHKTKKSEEQVDILKIKADRAAFKRNSIGLVIFVIILMTVTKIIIAGILSLILFVLLNPVESSEGKKIPSVSYYFKRIDAKLIYFFAILFITVYFMDLVGITNIIDVLVDNWGHHDVFLISVGILVISSLLSGFLDNAPITIMFLPIIDNLLRMYNHPGNPIFIAFTLGINLGGNFLPQGSACDMMTLELAKKNKVEGFTYKSLTLIGGIFALLHIILGIGYIAIYQAIFG